MTDKNGLPSFVAMSEVFGCPEAAEKYLLFHGCLEVPEFCPQCNHEVKYKYNKKHVVRCNRKSCAAEHGSRWIKSMTLRGIDLFD